MNLIGSGIILAFISVCLLCEISVALNNGLGRAPQMGWSSWNHFHCNISEELIKSTADKLVELRLDKKGYKYVNLDDCWQIQRNQTTKQIIEDFSKFPSGMHALSNYIHAKGLKFGLYSDAGYKTCQKRPGSFGFQTVDATSYAKWEVDYLKYDNCNKPENISAKQRFIRMRDALNNTGRPILFSICEWGQEKVWEWGAQVGNSWRTTGDIWDHWISFLYILDKQVGLQNYSTFGAWNDPDMLQVGNGKMSTHEYMAHFAFWCALKAPLIIGCNLNNISAEDLAILSNEQLIAINQDSLGVQAKRIKSQILSFYKRQVWGGPLSNNRYVILFLNRGHTQTQIKVSIKKQLKLQFESYTQRDPIRHISFDQRNKDLISLNVQPHSVQVRILKIIKTQK